MRCDYLIIGGGHNGLVAACYLAKAGNSVCLLERSDKVGGCAITEEICPGFKISSVAYAYSLFHPSIISDLHLEHAIKVLKRPIYSYTPDLEGYGLAMGDETLTKREIERYSKHDVQGYQEYNEFLENILSNVDEFIDEIPPVLTTNGRRLNIKNKLSNLFKLYRMRKGFKRADKLMNVADTVNILTGSATSVLDRFIEKDPLKVTLATDGIIGSLVSPSQLGSAYILLHHVMGESGGSRGVWGYVEGGMGHLSETLADCARSFGAKILTEHEVTEITVLDGKARGVVVNDKWFLATKGVLSGTTMDITFNRLLNDSIKHNLPLGFKQDVGNMDYEAACMKVNFALDRLPTFKNGKDCQRDQMAGLTGTVHIPSTCKAVELAFDDAKYGVPSQSPILEMTFPSTLDKTLAPEGKHVMSVLVQYTPYKLTNGLTWDQYGDNYADLCMENIERHAPGFKNLVIARQVITPLDLARKYGLNKGDIFHGSMKPSQMFSFRPVAGWSDHKTPIKNLYMCGSACHPGGGVTGIPGRNAAKVVLKDS